MDDFRLRVFVSVARNLSLTKASKELYLSQPAITKHVQELEATYKMQFFVRTTHGVTLTSAGKIFLQYVEVILKGYERLQFEMNKLSGQISGSLHIGASTTIAQYLLPKQLAKFMNHFPEIKLSLFTGNTEQIEDALELHKVDMGMVEGNAKRRGLKYTLLTNDKLVLVTHSSNTVCKTITLDQLSLLPLVLREVGSGTLEVIEQELLERGIKLSQMNILLQLGSTEGIKSFLQHNLKSYALLSIAAVEKELSAGILRSIEIKGVSFDRTFNIVQEQGAHNDYADTFIQFLTVNYQV